MVLLTKSINLVNNVERLNETSYIEDDMEPGAFGFSPSLRGDSIKGHRLKVVDFASLPRVFNHSSQSTGNGEELIRAKSGIWLVKTWNSN